MGSLILLFLFFFFFVLVLGAFVSIVIFAVDVIRWHDPEHRVKIRPSKESEVISDGGNDNSDSGCHSSDSGSCYSGCNGDRDGDCGSSCYESGTSDSGHELECDSSALSFSWCKP